MKWIVSCLVFLLVLIARGLHVLGQGAGTACPQLGNMLPQTRFFSDGDDDSRRRRRSIYSGPLHIGLLLDLSKMAGCSGRGVAWHYCFYLAWTDPRYTQVSHFSVYRQQGNGNVYEQVSESIETVQVVAEYSPQQFICNTVNVTVPFDVIEGDVIGVCLEDAPGTEPLDVFEYSSSSLLHHGSYTRECRSSNTAIVDTGSSSWHTHSGEALNVYLEIATPVETTHTFLPSTTDIPIPTTTHPETTRFAHHTSAVETLMSMLTSTTAVTIAMPATSSTVALASSTVAVASSTVVPAASSTVPATSSTVVPATSSTVVPAASSTSSGKTEIAQESEIGAKLIGFNYYMGIIAGGATLLLLVPACIITTVCCIMRRRQRHGSYSTNPTVVLSGKYVQSGWQQISTVEAKMRDLEKPHINDVVQYFEPASNVDKLLRQLQQLNLQLVPRKNIEITVLLGQGHFGIVNRGIWHDSSGMIYEVAVKSLVQGSPQLEVVKLLKEAAIMGQFRHPNVIQLHGVVAQHDQVMLLVELARNGDLRKYLKNTTLGPDMAKEFLAFSKDVAMGMYYLSRKGFVHRDLAARNVFLTTAKTCKIGDFGMSRRIIVENPYYISRGGVIPVRWTAPEALLFKKFSIASDVWSYGCLLYEIWSAGCLPFEELRDSEVAEKLVAGYRISQPPGCPRMIYELMSQCWHPEPHSRPSFRDVLISLLEYENSTLPTSSDPPAGSGDSKEVEEEIDEEEEEEMDEEEEVDEIYTEPIDIVEIYDSCSTDAIYEDIM